MKKLLLSIIMLFVIKLTYAQVEGSLSPIPPPTQDAPMAYPSKPNDKIQATKIIRAQKGPYNIWYCLVQFKVLSIDTNTKPRPNARNYNAGSGGYITPGIVYSNPLFGPKKYYSNPTTSSYDPNRFEHYIPQPYQFFFKNEITKEEATCIWIPANYETATTVGITTQGTPYMAGTFTMVYPITYMYNSGLLGMFPKMDTYYIKETIDINLMTNK